MPITRNCPACGKEIETPREAPGDRFACPLCAADIELPRVALENGVTVAGFQVKKLLGVGAMGEVYLARQISMDRDVALKLLPPEAVGSGDRLKRFMNEVRTLARLDHPNVVAAFEAGSDGDYHFLAMTYVPGDTLEKRIERGGPLPEAEAVGHALKLAETLAYFWDNHQMLHRDIKPANIMIDADGQLKLMDMGISRRTSDGQSRLTRTGLVVGTPHYMSPEQALATHDLNFASDMYSLGATLYSMVTGKEPYEAASPVEVMSKHVNAPPPSARAVNPKVSFKLDEVIRRMMAKEPRDRYPDWQSLIRELRHLRRASEAAAKHKHPHPHPHAPAAPLRTPALDAVTAAPARSGGRWFAVLAVLLAGVGIIGASLAGIRAWQTHQNRIQARLEEEQRQEALRLEQARLDEEERLRLAAEEEERRRLQREAAAAEQRLRDLFESAEAYARDNPEDYEGAIQRFAGVAATAAGTPLADRADARIQDLRQAWESGRQAVIADLDRQVADLVREQRFDEAIERLDRYEGPFAAATEAERQNQIREVQDRQAAALARQQQAVETLAELRRELARLLLAGEHATAVERLAAAINDPEMTPALDELTVLQEHVAAVGRLPRQVIAAFRPAADNRPETIALRDGTRQARVLGTEGLTVIVDVLADASGTVRIRQRFNYADLAPAEKLRRLGEPKTPADYLARGILCVEAGRLDMAERFIVTAASPLSRALLRQLDAREPERAESRAAAGYAALLDRFGIAADADRAGVIRAVWRTPPPEGLPAMFESWMYRFGQTDFAAGKSAELAALMARLAVTPLPPTAENLDRALRQLADNNPAARPLKTATRDLPGGPLLDLSGNPHLANLSGLKGLQLAGLDLTGSAVRDLGPLHGCPLVELYLADTQVRDLTPLAGMPLDRLNLARSQVRDLTPLAGSQLAVLDLSGNRISSLAPLEKSRIRELYLHGVSGLENPAAIAGIEGLRILTLPGNIADFSFLERLTQLENVGRDAEERLSPSEFLAAVRTTPEAGPQRPVGGEMAVERLRERIRATNPQFGPDDWIGVGVGHRPDGLSVSIWDARRMDRLDWVKGLPIIELNIAGSGVTDLTPLRETRIQVLDISWTRAPDLGHLVGTQIRELRLYGGPNRDLTPLTRLNLKSLALDNVSSLVPLRHLRLENLEVRRGTFSDLSPLQDMPLKTLRLEQVPVQDLTPLRRMPLTELEITGSGVRDLSPLRQLPLVRLTITDCPINNLTPLRDLKLQQLDISGTQVSSLAVLRGMPLRDLRANRVQVLNLDPLRELPLVRLELDNSGLRDVTGLRGMNLRILSLAGTPITDRGLTVLAGLQLNELRLHDCRQISDVSALANCQTLERLTVPANARGLAALKNLPRLRFLQSEFDGSWRLPAREFFRQNNL